MPPGACFFTLSRLFTSEKVYRHVHDMKCVCWRRSGFGIQSTIAQPCLPSQGHTMSQPIGSSPSQNTFMSLKLGSARPVRIVASVWKSSESTYLMLTPAVSLCRARMPVTRWARLMPSTPRSAKMPQYLLTVSGTSSHKSSYSIAIACSTAAALRASRRFWKRTSDIHNKPAETKKHTTPKVTSGKCHQMQLFSWSIRGNPQESHTSTWPGEDLPAWHGSQKPRSSEGTKPSPQGVH